jgi:type I restriction enzyme S subunit
MAGEFPMAKVGDLAKSISDTHKMREDKLIFLNTSDILHGKILHHTYTRVKDWPGQAKKSIRRNDILYSEIRPANGRWAHIDETADDFVVSTKLMVIRTKTEDVSARYLYQFLTSKETSGWLQHLAESRSGTFPQITFDQVASLDIPLPPLPEQRAIAHVLGTLDDLIELNRETNEILEEMARALFKSWFVDFDPVRAKLEGRPPAGMDAATAALFPDHFQDSELGQIPKGWEVGRLDQIASILMGLSPNGDSYNASGIGVPLINGPVEFGDYFPVKTKWTEAATRFCCEHDLIFCVRGSTTGRRVVSDGKYGIGRGVCAMRAKDGFHGFLYQTINLGLDRMLEKTTGSVFPSLSAPDIKGFSVLKPSEGVLNAFERAAKPLTLSIQENHKESRELAALRDTLLPKLLSGEVSAPTAEELIAAST